MLRRSGTDDLGEGREADAHQLAASALLGLLLQQRLVADRLERLVERLVIVAAVVGESECGAVGELLFLHEVLPPQLHRVDAELVGKDVHRALDRVTGFGHAERAAIGDASRRLVREVGVHLGVRDGHVVAAGNDTEHAGWVLRRVGRGVEGTVIGVGRDAKRGELAVGGRTKLDVHVVVARKPRRRQVLRPGLDPLHRPAQLQRANDGADIARDTPGLCYRNRRPGRATSRGSCPPGCRLRSRSPFGRHEAPGMSRGIAGDPWCRSAPRIHRVRAARDGSAETTCVDVFASDCFRAHAPSGPCPRPPNGRCGWSFSRDPAAGSLHPSST